MHGRTVCDAHRALQVNGITRFSTRCKYRAIYADPPWSFRNWSAKGTGRNAVSHYDCLDSAKLASLPPPILQRWIAPYFFG
jgi:hypothetical protein